MNSSAIMFVNIQSLSSHIDSLRQLVLDRSTGPPLLIAATECQVPTQEHSHLSINHYTSMYYPSPQDPGSSRRGGGTILYFHNSITCRPINQFSLHRLGPLPQDPDYGRTSSLHWFEAKLPNQNQVLIIGVIYVSPTSHSNPLAIQQVNQSIETVIDNYSHIPILIAGDINLRHEIWDKRMSSVAVPTQHVGANSFYTNMVVNHSLTLLNTEYDETRYKPTRIQSNSASVLDLCFANEVALSLVNSFEIGGFCLADHEPLFVRLRNQTSSLDQSNNSLRWDLSNKANDWKRSLPTQLDINLSMSPAINQTRHLLSFSNPSINQSIAQSHIQTIWDSIEETLNETMLQVIGKVKKHKTNYWWFNSEIREIHHQILIARQKWRRSRGTTREPSLLTIYRGKQQAFKMAAIQSRTTSLNNLYNSVMPSNNSPLLWQAVARLRTSKTRSAIGAIPDQNGNLPSSPLESLNNLCSKFVDFTIPERDVDPDQLNSLRDFVDSRLSSLTPHVSNSWSWTADDVKQQCKFQRNHRSAPGPDEFPPLVLRHLSDSFYSLVAQAFNYSWVHSVLPTQWTCANVFALLKNPAKPLDDPSNYRPISVTSIWIRTFEHLIHRKLITLVDPINQSILYDHQYGFRQSRSCNNALHLVISHIKEEQQANQTNGYCLPTPVAFVDMMKAFDRVCHLYLLHTADADFDIRGRIWRWIHRWLTVNRKIRCVANSVFSLWYMLTSYGVPQGAVLSPILFIVFINPIAKKISQSCPLIITPLFADDIAVMPKSAKQFHSWWHSSSSSEEKEAIQTRFESIVSRNITHIKKRIKTTCFRDIAVAIQFQRALSLFSQWLKQTGMQANAAKSKVVIFTAGRSSNLTWNNQSVKTHWFQHLQLDNFILEVTDSYEYLGVTLDQHLTFTQHIEKITTKATSISNLICRLFHAQKHIPHPLSAIKLVRAILLPTVTYAIEQWFDYVPSQSKSRDIIDVLHSIILKPIRAATQLPLTTHRLGMLVDFGIPTLHDLAAQARIRYYQRYSNIHIHSQSSVIQAISTRTLFSVHPIANVHPSVTRTILDAHYQSQINPNKLISQQKWTTVGAKTRYHTLPSIDQLVTKVATIPHLSQLPTVTNHITLSISQSQLSQLTIIDHNRLAALAHLFTFSQWIDQHKSNSPQHDRATSSPLTIIKKVPGTTPLLHCVDDKQALQILIRLRHGRAFTHDNRARFPSMAVQSNDPSSPPIDAFCKHPPCQTNQTLDSVDHLLLECPSHSHLRQILVDEWKAHCYGRTLVSVASLRLHMLLGEPPGTYHHKFKNKYIKWYQPLVKFIKSINTNLPTTEQYPKAL